MDPAVEEEIPPRLVRGFDEGVRQADIDVVHAYLRVRVEM